MHRMSLVMACTSLLLVSQSVTAQAGEPQELVSQTLHSLLAVLSDETLKAPEQRQERQTRIAQVVAPGFDFPEMARRALDQYWYRLTPAQQDEFAQLFSTQVLRSLVQRIASRGTTTTTGYGSVPHTIRYLRETMDPAGYASVQTAMTYAHEQAAEDLEYLLLRRNGVWKVYDVVADGAGMVSNYRAQFTQIIRQESYEDLLTRLKRSQE